MQLLWDCPLTDERYVSERAWEKANLECCPLHPEGGCGLERLGTYGRVTPVGVRVPRWWCPKARCSISLLPAFLAARLSGTLAQVEAAVAVVEETGGVAAAVDRVRPPDRDDAIGLAGALRWLRRRVVAVRAALKAALTLIPDRFMGLSPTLAAFGTRLGSTQVLVALRGLLRRYLGSLPTPVGFGARQRG